MERWWLRLSRAVDALSERLGGFVAWLCLAMILIGAFNAVVRYLGRFTGWNLSSNAYLELQWYLFSLIFLLGAAYTLRRDGHVRVDVLYARFSPRTRTWIDLLGGLLFLIPFCLFGLIIAWPSVRASWAIREMSSDPGGLPRYPIKSVILLAFGWLLLQAVSEVVKNVRSLRGLDRSEPSLAPSSEAEE